MSVSAFFKDSRVRAALAGKPPAQAGKLLTDFLAQFTYADCAPAELLALADLASRCGDPAMARTALETLVSAGIRLHLAHYKLGRLELADEDFGAALAHFQAGTVADANFAYNWMGAARALHEAGRLDEACTYAERFVHFGVRPHSTTELKILAALADHLFDANERARSLKLYDLVVKFGTDRPRDAIRLAEAYIAGGDFSTALQVLQAQEKRNRLDSWGRRALAVCYSHTGDHARAIAVAEAVALEDPANQGFVTTYLDALARAGDRAQMNAALLRHGAVLTAAGTTELTARIHLADGEVAAAAALLEDFAFSYQSRIYYLCFELAYAALGSGLLELATALGARLDELAPSDIYVKLLRIDVCFRQQLWEQAGAILAQLTPEQQALPHVVLKRFEHASFVGDVAGAEILRVELETLRAPNPQFMLPIFRYLAERGRWNDLIDRAVPWLDGNFRYDQIGYVLFRAAKHTGRQAAMMAAIEAIGEWQTYPDLTRLRGNLAYDQAETLADFERLAQDPTIAANPVLRRKLEIKGQVLARAMAQAGRRAIFLCSDRNYLTATIVALHSLTRATDRNGADFFIVLDDDLLQAADRYVAPFITAGHSVTLIAASQIVAAAEKLYASYGLFTSGHDLSSAANYRIYCAKHLADRGIYDRALYVDSDILVRESLEPLFVADLGDRPMGAKPEPMRPEVRRAIALHRLENDRYFNSGVLLFDLKHPRLAAGLDGAMAAILDDDITLLFHDQCALNVGFRGDFADLPQSWNYPVTESTELASVPAQAAILHFLDRPKPWSAAHGGDAAMLWFDHWRETAAFIGETNAVELFALITD